MNPNSYLIPLLDLRFKAEALDQLAPIREIGGNLALILSDVQTSVFEALVDAFAAIESRRANRLTNIDKNPFDIAEIEKEMEELLQLRENIAREIEFRWKLRSEIAKLKNKDQEAYLVCDAVFLLEKHLNTFVV